MTLRGTHSRRAGFARTSEPGRAIALYVESARSGSTLPRTKMKKTLLSLLVPLVVVACGGGEPDSDAMPEASTTPAAGTVTIVTPTNGALINGNEINVTLSSTVDIEPAGTMTAGTGHHHLYLNADLTPADQPVPTVPGSIVHMGDASSSYTFENVPSGSYRLIAVVADGAHMPLQPWVVDTVMFTVQNQ